MPMRLKCLLALAIWSHLGSARAYNPEIAGYVDTVQTYGAGQVVFALRGQPTLCATTNGDPVTGAELRSGWTVDGVTVDSQTVDRVVAMVLAAKATGRQVIVVTDGTAATTSTCKIAKIVLN